MELILSYGNLDEQPDLSHIRADDLFLNNNNISILWSELFPIGLKNLVVKHNRILSDGFPTELPDTIECINADDNGIVTLDDVEEWPANLVRISITNNPLLHLPFNFPASLREIDVRNTCISKIDALPSNLETLNICSTFIQSLPILPLTLKNLYMVNTCLKKMPDLSYTRLVSLDVSKNKLKELARLPKSLEHLNISYNSIESVEIPVGGNLRILLAYNNKIRKVVLPEQEYALVDLRENCLVERFTQRGVMDLSNWNEAYHDFLVEKIQKAWQIYKMIRAFHKWAFIGRSKMEIKLRGSWLL